ncbi:MAG: hypothetical protein M3680_18600 [Myxococcota bacterium]|nr:hypothetical protein [Myxococcota bacterium]
MLRACPGSLIGRGTGRAVRGASVIGRWTQNVAPGVVGALGGSTITAPPWCRTTPQTIDRPRPVPLPWGFVVKNGSNTRSCVASSMPGPVSETCRRT